jgi:hypothetical protein
MNQKRSLYNCLIKTTTINSRRKIAQLEPWRFRIDKMVVHHMSHPGLIYVEGPDPLRQTDFIQIVQAVLGHRGFKILRQPGLSTRPATLPRVQQAQHPHLMHKPGAPLPPLPQPEKKKWWTTTVNVYSMSEFASQMREMGIFGWYRQALWEDFEKPTKNVY